MCNHSLHTQHRRNSYSVSEFIRLHETSSFESQYAIYHKILAVKNIGRCIVAQCQPAKSLSLDDIYFTTVIVEYSQWALIKIASSIAQKSFYIAGRASVPFKQHFYHIILPYKIRFRIGTSQTNQNEYRVLQSTLLNNTLNIMLPVAECQYFITHTCRN